MNGHIHTEKWVLLATVGHACLHPVMYTELCWYTYLPNYFSQQVPVYCVKGLGQIHGSQVQAYEVFSAFFLLSSNKNHAHGAAIMSLGGISSPLLPISSLHPRKRHS